MVVGEKCRCRLSRGCCRWLNVARLVARSQRMSEGGIMSELERLKDLGASPLGPWVSGPAHVPTVNLFSRLLLVNGLRNLGDEMQAVQAKAGTWKRPVRDGLPEETGFVFLCLTCIVIKRDILIYTFYQFIPPLKSFQQLSLRKDEIQSPWNG